MIGTAFWRLLSFLLALSIPVFSLGCNSIMNQASEERESPSKRPTPVIADAEWSIREIGNRPKEESFLTCNSEGGCWLCNNRGIWLMNEGLQRVYSVDNDGGSDSGLSSVHFLSSTLGWMIKSGGLYQSQDGGATWIRVAIPEGMKPGDVYFRDSQSGILVGSRCRPLAKDEPSQNNAMCDHNSVLTGFILQTDNGGKTWRAPDVKWATGRFGFVDGKKDFAIVFGDAGCLATTDGGKSWKDILNQLREPDTGEVPDAHDAFFLDDENAWIALTWAQVLATHDGGKSWELVYHPDEANPNPSNLGVIAFVDQVHGLGITQDSPGGRLFKTSDGGKSWMGISADERFRQLTLTPATRRGVLLGTQHVYSISLK